MDIHIPTFEEIYRISYLVSKGWKYNYSNAWEKEGMLRELNDEEKEYNRFHRLESHPSKDWDLEDAYWAQIEIDEPSVKAEK